MNCRRAFRRALGAALGVGLCLAAGCAAGPARSGRPTPAPAGPSAQSFPAASSPDRAEAQAHFAAGIVAQIAGNTELAIDHYRQSLALDPHNVNEAIQLANMLVTSKEFTAAVAVLERAQKYNPQDASVPFWLGMTDRAADRTEQALGAFRRALKLDPQQINAVQALLEIYLQQKAVTEVAQVLDHAWAQKSEEANYWLRLGDLHAAALRQVDGLAKLIDPSRVAQCYALALALAPEDPEVLLRSAQWHEANNDPAEAAALYNRLQKLRPDDAGLRFKLAGLYASSGAKQEAVAALEELVKLDPLRFEVYNFLGELHEDLDQSEKAVPNYQQSLVINPNQIQPYLRIALLEQKLKRFDEAHRILGVAKEKFATDYRVPYFLGLLSSEEKKYPAAVAAFTDAETVATESPEGVQPDGTFYFYYGGACERAGDLTKAALLFRRSIELDPDQHLAYNYLGYMWADRGENLDEARRLIETAVTKDPQNGAYLDSLGWVLFKLGHKQEALTQLRRAVELEKDDPTVLDHLADVLVALGQKDEAITTLRRAHELAPTDKNLTEKLQKLAGDNAAAPAPK